MRTLAGLFLAMLALFVVDTFLAKTEQAESRVEAARLYASGQNLMRQGQSAAAADQFRSALAGERDNQDYQLALGQALLAAGKPDDAQVTLNDLLQRNPFGASANLAMARVLVAENKMDAAAEYYHRAIYGQWKDDARANQVKARFELTDLLSHQSSQEALLAELLPLQDEAPNDIATRKKLGHLFIAAGSPARAADIFRAILRVQPQDADAFSGLGQAEFARGNYRTAQTEFLMALRLRPEDNDTRQHLELDNQVLELDPTLRGLPPEEQFRRSQKLAALVLDDVNQCLGAAASPPEQELIKDVQDGLKQRVPAARQSAAVEKNLNWADQLWQVRKTSCKQNSTASEKPLALVLALLAR